MPIAELGPHELHRPKRYFIHILFCICSLKAIRQPYMKKGKVDTSLNTLVLVIIFNMLMILRRMMLMMMAF